MAEAKKSKQFQRRIEDFRCEHCGADVEGNGFTNHCPECLWSQHVDHNPGDRQAVCGGLMEPIALLRDGAQWKITHRCSLCHKEKNNKTQTQDNFDTIVTLAKQLAENRN